MTENLSNLLVDLAVDPDRMARFRADPASELDAAGLTPEEKAALIAQDGRRLAGALGELEAARKRKIIEVLHKKRRPGPPKKKKRGPARPSRKKR